MNNPLQRFHRYALVRSVWPIAIAIGLIAPWIEQKAPDSVWSEVIAFITSSAVVVAACLYLEKKIRLDFWRIAYPELDFTGTWSGGTQYAQRQSTEAGADGAFLPFEKQHKIRFRQDCLNIMIEYDRTNDYHGWNSTVATLVTEAGGRVGLRYAYQVVYRQDNERDYRLPNESKGLEEVFVIDSRQGERPRRITGTFTHTADGPRPRYSGTVAFEREVVEPKSSICAYMTRLVVTTWMKPPLE